MRADDEERCATAQQRQGGQPKEERLFVSPTLTVPEERQGLASIAGKWKEVEEIGNKISALSSLRKDSGTRQDISL